MKLGKCGTPEFLMGEFRHELEGLQNLVQTALEADVLRQSEPPATPSGLTSDSSGSSGSGQSDNMTMGNMQGLQSLVPMQGIRSLA